MLSALAIILAGGEGSRLKPLTQDRAKPAVPFGGKYRIIDFTLANCLHSGLRNVLVLTQYKSHSLQKHLRDGWSIFNPELGEYVTAVPAQMRTGHGWYKGTADAIYQNLYLLERSDADAVIVLSGDHIYRMDYAAMMAAHEQNEADVTIACIPVPISEATQFGVVGESESHQVVSFSEKPEAPDTIPGQDDQALASMGIYIFSKKLMLEQLALDSDNTESSHDFGHDILPKLIQSHRVFAYHFGGSEGRVSSDQYWRDVGTIDAFYQANMDLLEPNPPIDLYQVEWGIRSYQPQFPPARTTPGARHTEGIFINSIMANGTVIEGGTVDHSILFHDVVVHDSAMVENSILFDGVRVGEGAQISNCIIDKGVKIPAGEQIGLDSEQDKARFTVSGGGIVVVEKDAFK